MYYVRDAVREGVRRQQRLGRRDGREADALRGATAMHEQTDTRPIISKYHISNISIISQ